MHVDRQSFGIDPLPVAHFVFPRRDGRLSFDASLEDRVVLVFRSFAVGIFRAVHKRGSLFERAGEAEFFFESARSCLEEIFLFLQVTAAGIAPEEPEELLFGALLDEELFPPMPEHKDGECAVKEPRTFVSFGTIHGIERVAVFVDEEDGGHGGTMSLDEGLGKDIREV